MYDTEKRIELVKKRMHEYHRRQERRTVCRLSVLCTLLFLSLVGTMGIMHSQPIDITGMYGAILLHEDAGGYVLDARDWAARHELRLVKTVQYTKESTC